MTPGYADKRPYSYQAQAKAGVFIPLCVCALFLGSCGFQNPSGQGKRGGSCSFEEQWLCELASYEATRANNDVAAGCNRGFTDAWEERSGSAAFSQDVSEERSDRMAVGWGLERVSFSAQCPIGRSDNLIDAEKTSARDEAATVIQIGSQWGVVELEYDTEQENRGPQWARCGLEAASLREQNVSRGLFDETDFYYADLTGADLSYSRLVGATFLHPYDPIELRYRSTDDLVRDEHGKPYQYAPCAKNTNFENSDMRALRGHRMCARGASFKNADLRGADLSFANLEDADFSGALIGGADFTGANLEGANFTGAVFYDPGNYTDILEAIEEEQPGRRFTTVDEDEKLTLQPTPPDPGMFSRLLTSFEYASLNQTVIDSRYFAGVSAWCAAGMGTKMHVDGPVDLRFPAPLVRGESLPEGFPIILGWTAFREASFVNSNLRWAHLRSAFFIHTDLRGVNFVDTSMASAKIQQSLLCGSVFNESEARQESDFGDLPSLSEAVITQPCFACSSGGETNCQTAESVDGLVDYTEGNPAKLGNVNFMAADITGVDRSCELRRAVYEASEIGHSINALYSQDHRGKFCSIFNELGDAESCVEFGFLREQMDGANEVLGCGGP